MKAGLLCLAGLSAVVVAQPHRRHHHQKRAVVYDVVTEVDVTTATAGEAMVYVDQNGKPTATSYLTASAATTSTSSLKKAEAYHSPAGYHHHESSTTSSVDVAPTTASSSSSSVYIAPIPSSTSSSVHVASTTSVYVAPTTYAAPSTSEAPASSSEASIAAPAPVSSSEASSAAPVSSTKATSAAPAPTTYSEASSAAPVPTTYSESSSTASAPTTYSSSSSSSGSGQGLTYSPYKVGGCKTTEEVATDFEQLDGYSTVRIYGTDCNQVANVLAAAKPKGMKLFAGVYDIDACSSELDIIISAVSGDWSAIDTIAIGNELVNAGTKTPAEVGAAVSIAKTLLSAAGFTGNVVTVDTFVAIIANPAMCDIGDYVAANCHAFFDGGVTASQAGEFVVSQAQRVSSACGGKKTVITESGWPSKGDSNKKAVPSEANQEAAITSLKSSFTSDIFLFNAYNDLWKSDTSSTFGAEKYWGMYGNSAAS